MADKKNYLDKTGLSHLWSKIKTYVSGARTESSKKLAPICAIGSDAASSAGWYKVADSTMSGYGNSSITYLVKSGYESSHVGILHLEMRSDSSKISCWSCKWLIRSGFSSGDIKIVIDGMKWTMFVYNGSGQYGRIMFTILEHVSIGSNGGDPTFTVNHYNTNTKETAEPAASTTSSDGGRANVANNADYATKAAQDVNGVGISTGYLRQYGDYLNTHPENSGTILPFMNNDIAFLTERGGTVKVYYDGVEQTISTANMFDSSSSYWANNPTGITEVVIELTLHKVFTWTNTIYVDHGSSGWRAKNVKIEVTNSNYADDVWVARYTNTAQTKGNYFTTFTHQAVGSTNGSSGFNKIRFTFSDWTNATIFRIAQLGVIMYGSSGLRETNMSRGIDDPIFRNITPNTDNKYNLGSATKRWSNIYATTINGGAKFTSPVKWEGSTALPASTNLQYILGIDAFADGGQTKYINKNDMIVGKANTLSTPRTINEVPFDGSSDITVTANPTPNQLTDSDLDFITTPGFYYGGGGNTCTNKPSGADAFGMIVYKTANGYVTQEFTNGNNNPLTKYIRQNTGSSWSTWKNIVEDNGVISSNDTIKNVVTLTKSEYEALTTKERNTLYNITDDNSEGGSSSSDGGLSDADREKLDGISESADAVSYTQDLATGTKIGTITINGIDTEIYVPTSSGIVSFTQSLTSGTKIGTITINGTGTDLYAPAASSAGAITTQVKSYTSGNLTANDVASGTSSFTATGPGTGWYPTCVTANANTTTVLSNGVSLRGSGIAMTSAGNNTCSGSIFFSGNGGGTCRGTCTYYVTWAKLG